MASTSMSLGKHWEDFLRYKVATGRYASATDVVRAGLRQLELQDEARLDLIAELEAASASGSAGNVTADDIRRSVHDDILRDAKEISSLRHKSDAA